MKQSSPPSVRPLLSLEAKFIIAFIIIKLSSLAVLTIFSWHQVNTLGNELRNIAVDDSIAALTDIAVINTENMTESTAHEIAKFLYARDQDILFLARITPDRAHYERFISRTGKVSAPASWQLNDDGTSWIRHDGGRTHTNSAPGVLSPDEWDGFHSRSPAPISYKDIPLYDEITFFDTQGNELIKVVSNSPKTRYPLDPAKKDISIKSNTYIGAETYFSEIGSLREGEIYVSDLIGAYTPSNYVGQYTPDAVRKASETRGYDIAFSPEEQSYAGRENPVGRRYEGIIRWVSPVYENGRKIGYVSFALNHDHLMEMTDHITPIGDGFVDVPCATSCNFAALWDAECRNMSHPRHSAICGYDPDTGKPQVPWLEDSIYDAWQASGISDWHEYVERSEVKHFDGPSSRKSPSDQLAKQGLVAIDGRFANSFPAYAGWMDITKDGGSGSFYLMTDGVRTLVTAAAIPYYTGRWAPSEKNGYSKRGFGFVTVSAVVDQIAAPAVITGSKINNEIEAHTSATLMHIVMMAIVMLVAVILIAFGLGAIIAKRLAVIASGVMRFRRGELHFRFNSKTKDEIGLLSDAFDMMADGIRDNFRNALTITDLDGRIVHMNDIALDFCETTIEEAIGRRYEDVSVYPHDSASDPMVAIKTGHESQIFHFEKGDRWLKPIARYLTGLEGEVIGYLIETIDVTELHRMQEDLEHAIREATEASMHKSAFLARMSHEIRTPMNAIIGLTGVIQKRLEQVGRVAPQIGEISDNMEKIELASRKLLAMLNDVLEISNLESGKIELEDHTAGFDELIASISNIVEQKCEEKRIRYKSTCGDIAGRSFEFDSLRFHQAVIGLLDHAIKHAPIEGNIAMTIRRAASDEGRTLISVEVTDDGSAISEETTERIFDPFEQSVDSNETLVAGGAGLGLPISMRIVRLFGGTLEIENRPEGGTRTHFSIWLKDAEAEEDDGVSIEDLEGRLVGRKMLLVDDVEINRVIVATLLEDTGIEIDEAEDGSMAVEKFAQSAPGEYDIIMMDIQMPVMDGYAASVAIRDAHRADAETVPIVALSANAFRDDIKRSKECRMNDHLAKPVDDKKLARVLSHFLC